MSRRGRTRKLNVMRVSTEEASMAETMVSGGQPAREVVETSEGTSAGTTAQALAEPMTPEDTMTTGDQTAVVRDLPTPQTIDADSSLTNSLTNLNHTVHFSILLMQCN